jgi:hypothetical protein
MKDNRMKYILESIARRNVPEDINLMPQIAAQIGRKSFMKTLRTRPLVAIVLALLILLALTGVAYAIGKSLGYIPGLGVVETSSLRVLAEPVSDTQDGVTVSVYKGFTDINHTELVIKIESQVEPSPNLNCGNGTDLLRLPDGGTLAIQQSGGSNDAYWMVFPPLPAGITTATLQIPCLPFFSAPGNWEFPLTFRHASQNEVVQILEIPAQLTPTETAQVLENSIQTTPMASNNGLVVKLENMAELDDGYVLMGSLHWDSIQNDNGGVWWSDDNVSVTDANGNIVAFQSMMMDDPSYWNMDQQNMMTSWAYKIIGKDHAWPVTLSIKPAITLPANVSFPMDFGASPQPGQHWELNKDMPIGNHILHILAANLGQYVNRYQLDFEMSSDTIIAAFVYIKDHPTFGGGGGGGGGNEKIFTAGSSYDGSFPVSGPQTIIVTNITVLVDIPLQVDWQP